MKWQNFLSEHSRELFFLSIIALLFVVAFFPPEGFPSFFLEDEEEFQSENQVAILDQFRNEEPNFTKEVIELFENQGISVDVYENITIDLYRKLPKLGYKVVIARIHTASWYRTEEGVEWKTGLFTTEEYNPSKYPVLQTKGLVSPARARENKGNLMFSIKPKFVKREMEGKFDDTLLILNACSVYYTKSPGDLLKNFYTKGISGVFGWSGPVTLSHADLGTFRFLEKIFSENITLRNAGEEVLEEVGSDPKHGSEIVFSAKDLDLTLKVRENRIYFEKSTTST